MHNSLDKQAKDEGIVHHMWVWMDSGGGECSLDDKTYNIKHDVLKYSLLPHL